MPDGGVPVLASPPRRRTTDIPALRRANTTERICGFTGISGRASIRRGLSVAWWPHSAAFGVSPAFVCGDDVHGQRKEQRVRHGVKIGIDSQIELPCKRQDDALERVTHLTHLTPRKRETLDALDAKLAGETPTQEEPCQRRR